MHEQIYVSFTEYFHYGPQKRSRVHGIEEASADLHLSEYTDCALAVGSSWAKDG